MDIVLIILGLILSLVGMAGCLLPVLPGPPLSYGGLILVALAKDWEPFSLLFLVIMAILTVLVTLLDNVTPALGAKKYGAARMSVWLSIAGTLAGLIMFPPWGMFIGAFIGALAGELISGKDSGSAMKAGFGVFVGVIVGIGMKLALSAVMLFFTIKALF